MKSRLHRISPKLTLIASVLLLVLALGYLWTALDYAMPTPGLALRKIEAEYALPPQPWARYSPVFDDGTAPAVPSDCFFSRSGDTFYVAQPVLRAPFVWEGGFFNILPVREDNPLLILCLAGKVGAAETPGGKAVAPSREVNLVVADDSAVARVTLSKCPYTLREDSSWALHPERAIVAECTETAPGSGFWIAAQQVPDGFENVCSLACAYDKDGNLLYSTEQSIINTTPVAERTF